MLCLLAWIGLPLLCTIVLRSPAIQFRPLAVQFRPLTVQFRPLAVHAAECPVPQSSDNSTAKTVRYEDFGAVGDGETDDFAAIIKAHAFANKHSRPIVARDEATYYIGGQDATAIIQTDTNFGSAKFIIDDRKLVNVKASVFVVPSTLKTTKLTGVTSLKRNQKNLGVKLPATSIVTVTNSSVRQYIRKGLNRNKGKPMTDSFLVDATGKVHSETPIIWDFDQITKITAQPIETSPLTIRGGHFTTIANIAESKYDYHARNILVKRSLTQISGIEHRITGEGKQGAPYGGFINITGAANVVLKKARLTGHKTYKTIGNANKPVPMGSYDLQINRSLNVLIKDCEQINDINDNRYWGIMASNYSKNLEYDNCTLSRFDAHMGVANATIRNSTLGHAGVNAIGCGTLLIVNTTLKARTLINLRKDYGSTWEGEMIIRNCHFLPGNGKATRATLINGRNDGQHDFGYPCFMPKTITIDGLVIDDSNHPVGYKGPVLFANFNAAYKNKSYEEAYPYQKTKKVILRGVNVASGKAIQLSDNPSLFAGVEVVDE